MYQIVLKKAARKSFKKINKRYKKRIMQTIFALANNPYLGKQLEGSLQNFYSVRVWPYRIVYKIYRKDLVILIVEIAYRQGVYK